MVSYYDRVRTALPHEVFIGLYDIMRVLSIPSAKQTYVIAGIKKGLALGTIEMHEVEGNRNKYSGNLFRRRG